MDPGLFDVFHDPADHRDASVADRVDVDLDRVGQKAIDQHRVLRARGDGLAAGSGPADAPPTRYMSPSPAPAESRKTETAETTTRREPLRAASGGSQSGGSADTGRLILRALPPHESAGRPRLTIPLSQSKSAPLLGSRLSSRPATTAE